MSIPVVNWRQCHTTTIKMYAITLQILRQQQSLGWQSIMPTRWQTLLKGMHLALVDKSVTTSQSNYESVDYFRRHLHRIAVPATQR